MEKSLAAAGRGWGREEEGGWGEGGGGERPRRFRRGAGVRGEAQGGMGWGKSFPMVGKLFSNHWKMGEKFFQSLEKSSGIFQSLEREQKGRLECGRDANIENHENRFADIEKWKG